MTLAGFLLWLGLGALTVALATGFVRVGRWGRLVVFCIVVATGLLTIPLVTVAALGSAWLVDLSRPAMSALYPASSFICGGALWLAAAAAIPTLRAFAVRNAHAAGLALSLHTAGWFIAFDIGKIAHDAEMRQFFASSQLPIWSMYVVLVAEISGSIGLCISRWRGASALMLALIMLGALGTHLRNGDPPGDSLDALRMLLLLIGIFAFTRRRSRAALRAD